MKISLYIRVSTEEQAKEGYSLEVQKEYLESFAKKKSFEIFGIYQDGGISGYACDRSALKVVLKDAKQRKFDLVLVRKIDRFDKNFKDLLILVDKLSFYGVGSKPATDSYSLRRNENQNN